MTPASFTSRFCPLDGSDAALQAPGGASKRLDLNNLEKDLIDM